MAEPARMPAPIASPPTTATPEPLTGLAEQLVAAVAGLAISKVTSSVDGVAGRLTHYAAHGGPSLTAALRGPRPERATKSRKRPALHVVGGVGDRISDAAGTGRGLAGKVRSARDDDDDDDEYDDEDEGDDTGESGDGGDGGGGRGFFGGAMDKVKGLFGGGGGDDGDSEEGGGGGEGGEGGGSGGGKGLKVTNIVETVDVGVPLRLAYNQWTQFQDFSDFMKKVESVEQQDDEKVKFQAKIFWSRRTWEATIVEQIADTHIVWRSSGAKGSVDGCVSFHELAPNLTRILVVLEYSPKGLFEGTANLWRAQGRRARLEIKHYRRHVMTKTILEPDEVVGWRGEIRDSEVVKTHEEALQEEEDAQDQAESESDEDQDFIEDEDAADEDMEDEGDYDEEDEADEEPAEEMEDEDAPEEEPEDAPEEPEDSAEEDVEDEAEEEAPRRSNGRRSRRRAPARAGR